jgi:5-hydroxyisourate hydrolase
MISTHVLDTARGKPAAGVRVTAYLQQGEAWERRDARVTDDDGRCRPLVADVTPGVWKLVFDTGAYDPDGFFPEAHIVFRVRDAGQHYHVPLLLSPFGYSTYRGS